MPVLASMACISCHPRKFFKLWTQFSLCACVFLLSASLYYITKYIHTFFYYNRKKALKTIQFSMKTLTAISCIHCYCYNVMRFFSPLQNQFTSMSIKNHAEKPLKVPMLLPWNRRPHWQGMVAFPKKALSRSWKHFCFLFCAANFSSIKYWTVPANCHWI